MNKTDRILFFASGDFPVKTFQYLLDNQYNIVGLVTSKDKHTFKDSKDLKSVYQIASEHNIDILVPTDLDSDETYDWISNHQPDILCVISYKKLSDRIIKSAKKCAFNIHASILPYLRGAAPINHAIRLGFKETGLTAFILNDKIDSGYILDNVKTEISDNDNFKTLYWRLADMCVDFCRYVLDKMIDETFYSSTVSQSVPIQSEIFKAPKIHNEYTMRYMHRNPDEINRLFRSIYPVDGLYLKILITNLLNINEAFAVIKDLDAKIFDYQILTYKAKHSRHWIDTDYKKYFRVRLSSGTTPTAESYWLDIKVIQPAGKRVMNIDEFLRGLYIYKDKDWSIRDYA